MEVRTASKTGPAVAPLPEVLAMIGKRLDAQQAEWLQQLARDPSRFVEVEGAVHAAFQQFADQMTAGLLAQVGKQPQLAEAAKKK